MTGTKVFVVTGAAGNVGAALTMLLSARGAKVAGVDRAQARAGAAAMALVADDLGDPAMAVAAVAKVAEELGRVDGVVTTVGGFAMGSLADSGPDLWERMYRINVITALNMFRAAIPHLRAAGGGSLVAIGAGAAVRAPAGMAAYAAAKSGVLRLVESAADEFRRERIRVNAVLPGTIDTPQNRAAMPDADPSLWTTPLEVAEVIAFLLSDAASGVTGAAIAVPGRA
jgi:NAD(P)-dependent dehydrogenase (short-subunit alcohol dehydrogenase family)